MTDKEMIKAIECCLKSPVDCDNCAYTKYPVRDCNTILKNDIADLINRQQQEIERLKAENDKNFEKWEILDKRTKERYSELYEEAKGVVRAEAVKEFAEKLKEKTPFYEGWGYITIEKIDNLVKEMVGTYNGD